MPGDWTKHPKLQGRFHAEFPDDLQVIDHDGHPPITKRGAELVWVRMSACGHDVPIFGDRTVPLFRAIVLNKPQHLQTLSEGTEIQFLVPEGGKYPLQVTENYLQERASWRMLTPCTQCGLSELFDPPSAIVRHSFPNVTADQLSGFTFTTKCGWCGGGQVVRLMRRSISS